MDKLKELLSKCKCGVYLTVNKHRNYYETAAQYIKELDEMESQPEISPEVRAKIIETETVVDLQFYPNTPIGSYCIIHWDLDLAIEMALKCFDS